MAENGSGLHEQISDDNFSRITNAGKNPVSIFMNEPKLSGEQFETIISKGNKTKKKIIKREQISYSNTFSSFFTF